MLGILTLSGPEIFHKGENSTGNLSQKGPVLSELSHEEVTQRSASIADSTRIEDAKKLIFDIRELLAQYVLENPHD